MGIAMCGKRGRDDCSSIVCRLSSHIGTLNKPIEKY
jgi:hypothetical protein